MTEAAENEFAQAQAALAADDTLTALSRLERALKLDDRAGWYSYMGYCIARERGQQRKGLELCLHALEAEPDFPDHFLNMGRVHLLGNEKEEALKVLRDGMAAGGSPEIVELLERLGTRKQPLFPALSRTNPLNKHLGLLLSRLGLR
jgi:tetratricopeptide (TPR) repeat protein